MNPVQTLMLVLLLLVATVTAWLLYALKRDRLRTAAVAHTSTNVEALRIERAALDRDVALGLLTPAAHSEAMAELEVRVLRESALDEAMPSARPATRSWWATISLAVFLPVAAASMYLLLGAPQAVHPEVARPEPSKEESQMDELFRMAEGRLKAQPDDAKGWYLLARAKASVGRFGDAMKDYETLMKLAPNDPDAWADYADAAAGAAQGKIAGKPLELVGKALALDANQPKALLLRGTHEIQINDLVAAEKSFSLVKKLSDPQTGFAQIADNALKDIAARRSSGNTGATAASTTSAATPAPLIAVTLNLSDEAKKAAANHKESAVFVIIRAADSTGGPPLAVKKLSPAALNQPIEFSAADAMIGGSGLTPGREIVLDARLSLTAQPRAQAGDFSSERTAFALSAEGKTVVKTVSVTKKIE